MRPSLAFGMRVDDGGATKVHLEGGVALVHTMNDPAMDTSLTGALAGIRVQHPVGDGLELVADAQAMLFGDGIRAKAGRVGVRYHGAQLSMRALDFNIGPTLWGPELGFGF